MNTLQQFPQYPYYADNTPIHGMEQHAMQKPIRANAKRKPTCASVKRQSTKSRNRQAYRKMCKR